MLKERGAHLESEAANLMYTISKDTAKGIADIAFLGVSICGLRCRVCFMTSGEVNMDAAREVHPLKSIGCFIKKPITAEEMLRRIRAELE